MPSPRSLRNSACGDRSSSGSSSSSSTPPRAPKAIFSVNDVGLPCTSAWSKVVSPMLTNGPAPSRALSSSCAAAQSRTTQPMWNSSGNRGDSIASHPVGLDDAHRLADSHITALRDGVLDHDAVASGLDLLADLLRLDLVERIALAKRLARLLTEP